MSGIIPIQHLKQLVEQRVIGGTPALDPSQLQPNSFDLRVGTIAYRVRFSLLPVATPVAACLEQYTLETFDLTSPEGVLLETGKIYVIPLCETLALPSHFSGTANPKSSTGRLDILARVITDGGTLFDVIRPGYHGPLYLEVVPRAFPIRLRAYDTVSQLRIVEHPCKPLSNESLRREIATHHLVRDTHGRAVPIDTLSIDDGVFLSIDVGDATFPDNVIGYTAKRSTPAIDLRRRDHRYSSFWHTLTRANDGNPLVLEPQHFYIFSSRERVVIPPHLCAEMIPFDAKSGELRTHYAGFFDSGFGYGTEGARVVLEVRNLDVPFLVQPNQPIFRLQFFYNSDIPERLYGAALSSHYQGQGLKLSKHFSSFL